MIAPISLGADPLRTSVASSVGSHSDATASGMAVDAASAAGTDFVLRSRLAVAGSDSNTAASGLAVSTASAAGTDVVLRPRLVGVVGSGRLSVDRSLAESSRLRAWSSASMPAFKSTVAFAAASAIIPRRERGTGSFFPLLEVRETTRLAFLRTSVIICSGRRGIERVSNKRECVGEGFEVTPKSWTKKLLGCSSVVVVLFTLRSAKLRLCSPRKGAIMKNAVSHFKPDRIMCRK